MSPRDDRVAGKFFSQFIHKLSGGFSPEVSTHYPQQIVVDESNFFDTPLHIVFQSTPKMDQIETWNHMLPLSGGWRLVLWRSEGAESPSASRGFIPPFSAQEYQPVSFFPAKFLGDRWRNDEHQV